MSEQLLTSLKLKPIIQKIVNAGNPIKILLFGSRARGDAHSESDYDFLIIEESVEKRYKRAAKYRRALKEMPFAKDIVVWTPAEIDAWQSVPNAFITTALKEGIVLYER
ncbi:nucleotidyltransferase domain-containing protein [candidate division KSB1 bacterium]|nr:nucleotidyltransferase domain-containing protein [candidate division KSB1 bacterium]